MAATAFRTRIEAAIKDRLGVDALDRYSIEELVSRLSLSVSRETLRKILREGHAPREKVQEQLLSEISAAAIPTVGLRVTAEAFYGSATADEVRGLLGRDASFFKVEPAPDGNPSDLLINQLGGHRILVRCLDDQVREGLAAEDYFRPTVDSLVEAMRSLDIDRALLITHTTPSPRAERTADAAKVTIQTYAAFIQQVLDLASVERSLSEKMARRGLDQGFLSLPVWEVTEGGESACDNSYETLLAFLEEAKGVGVATLIGSYGSGKTSLALKIASKIAQRSVRDKTKWVLPLWVSARISDQSSLKPNLDQELSAALRLLAPTTHIGPETLRRLVSSGRAWLFVDGLDEALTLRSREKLRRFLDALLDYCQPHGRLVLTIRQEVFDSRHEEVGFFDRGMLAAGATETVILRTRPLKQSQIEHIIRARRDQSEANRLVADIKKSPAVQDLVTRPIFLNILTNAGVLPAAMVDSGATLQLFESYVEMWAEEEQRRTIRLDLPPDQRFEICEFMALYAARYGEKDGISSDDIEQIARELDRSLTIRNMEAFIVEARVAMFLERVPDTDRFHFSHASLRSFFVARRIGREIAESQDFKNLEPFAFDRGDPLLRFFLLEKIREYHLNPRELLERTLEEAVHGDWRSVDRNWRSPFRVGPCFSYLVPNLTALILDLRIEAKDETTPVHLEGSHLANFNLDGIWGTAHKSPLLLNAANLEGARLTVWSRQPGRGAIPPGNVDPARARAYCEEHNLFAPARFSADERDRFVLIPGGSYSIAPHIGGKRDPNTDFAEVTLRSYLIQRYPVTNRQFRAFLQTYPQYRPSEVRVPTNNPYYLLNWPESDEDPRVDDSGWLDRPVVHINWLAADAFAAACGLRLPTEVEWEVASRYTGEGGATTLRPWGEDINRSWAVYWDAENGNDESPNDTSAEAKTEKSPPLLPSRSVYDIQPAFKKWAQGRRIPYHMVDLVREWVADRWDPTYPCLGLMDFSYLNDGFRYDTNKDVWLPADARQVLQVLRGGSFQTTEADCTSEYRASHPPKNVNPDGGFRCVRPIMVPWAGSEK